MSKRAEEAAMKAYPVCIVYRSLEQDYEDINGCYRVGFEMGYEQAEKDILAEIGRMMNNNADRFKKRHIGIEGLTARDSQLLSLKYFIDDQTTEAYGNTEGNLSS